MSIPPSFIQELVARADVVDIVGRHVQLKKGGANYMGLCPFHGEKSPSFSVSPTKQFYHCFGCGKNGNAISFLMDFAGMSFVEAVKDLAQQLGMQVPEDERSPQERARDAQVRTRQASLTEVLAKCASAYQDKLAGSERGVSYFKGRGLSGEIAKKYGLGYSPEGYRFLAGVFPDYDDKLLVESGMVIERPQDDANPEGVKKKYDRFRDRVMFPIRNVKGEFIGFGGRVLDKGEPKYLNSPETPVFSKGRELYGLFEARESLAKAGYVLVTEGYMDVVALAQLGFPNAVATLGTACTPDHVQKLFRFTDSVVFAFDGDGAGRRAARKALDVSLAFASDTRTVKFLFLPPEHDPDSFIREHGEEAFRRYVGEAVPLSRFLVDAARDGLDIDTAEGRAHLAANARPLWTALPEGALKKQLLRELAGLVGIDERELAALWKPAPSAAAGSAGSSGNSNYYKNNSKLSNKYAGGKDMYAKNGFRKPYGASAASSAIAGSAVGRHLPPSRADRALQIALLDAASWERLSSADHQLLCELATPHGEAFVWLDAQHQDHGSQPWAALSIALQGQSVEQKIRQLVAKVPDVIENDSHELENILRELRKQALQSRIAELSQLAPSDPAAYEELKRLMQQSKLGA
jgi:DNA primase